MGIVKRQSFNNSVFNYLGQVIGYLNIAILFPILLSQDEFGLTRLLTSISLVFAQIASFGAQRVVIKFFPFFQSPGEKHHNGFLSMILINTVLGFLLVLVGFMVMKEWLVAEQDSELFGRFFFIIPTLALLTMLTWVFDSYLKALLRTSLSAFLNNILLKLLWLGSALAYYYDYLSIDGFIITYCSVHAVLVLIMIGYLVRIGEFSLQINPRYYRWRIYKHIIRYGANAIIDDTNSTMMNHVDKIMIGFMMNLESVAIYTVASYLSTIITIPSISMGRIINPLVAKHWKKKQRDKIAQLYTQSASLSLVMAGSLFVLLWSNIDSIMQFIEKEYASGVYVILFLMLAQLSSLAFGINGNIIIISRHYWFNSVSGFILVVLMIIFNLIFIPMYGFLGAAIGTLLAKMVFNVIKYLFLKAKENLDPFTPKNLVTVIILAVAIGVGQFVQFDHWHFVVELFVKSAMLTVLMAVPMYAFKVSPEINEVIVKQWNKWRKRLT